MGKKAGVVPQINKAVGDATLGKMGNSALPFTPAHVLGNKTSSDISEGVGAGGSGLWGAYSPSPTKALLDSNSGGGSTGMPSRPVTSNPYQGSAAADGGRAYQLRQMYAGNPGSATQGPSGRSPMDNLTLQAGPAAARPGKSSGGPPNYAALAQQGGGGGAPGGWSQWASQATGGTPPNMRPSSTAKSPANVPGYPPGGAPNPVAATAASTAQQIAQQMRTM